MKPLRTLAAVAAAMVTLAFAANHAAASTAAISPAGTYSASSRLVRLVMGSFNITCDMTLTGSLNASTSTTPGQSLGQVTGGTASWCLGATSLSIDAATPWELTIAAMLGTLPNFSGVLFNLRTARFTLVWAGVTCRYAGIIGALVPNERGATANGSIERMNLLANSLSRQADSSSACPSTASFSTPQQFVFDQPRDFSIS